MSEEANSEILDFSIEDWKEVTDFFENRFDKIPDLTNMLFIIGHREIGQNLVKLSKEQKQDVIHVGVCALLSLADYYTFKGIDEDGWTHYEYNRNKEKLTHEQQERLLKKMIIQYIKKL